MMKNSLPLRWPTRNGLPSFAVIISIVVVVGLIIWATPVAEIDPLRIIVSTPRLISFLSKIIVVPDIEYLPELFQKMLETIEMTFLATSIALVISFPIGFLAAKNTSPHPVVSNFIKTLLSLMRALPELVWALVFVSALGLGPFPGVMAMSFVTVGFMGKFFAESIEVVDPKPIEGVEAHGAGWLQVRTFGYLPQAMPDFIGSTLYILDHNLRAAAILGLVGAGGVGYDMVMAMRLYDYGRITGIALAIYLSITLLDRLSNYFRRKVI
jgi:phosphonate transport system permease protein